MMGALPAGKSIHPEFTLDRDIVYGGKWKSYNMGEKYVTKICHYHVGMWG
jgi:hypothetical protein